MKFGLFGGAQAVPGEVITEAALGYHEYGEYIQTAERLGYTSAWMVEHHFTGFSQLSATLNYISYLSGITSKIRLGSAVVVVPWHNPVLLAEQVATVDQLSKGRYDFGVGRGYRANEFHGFGIDMKNAEEIFQEISTLTPSYGGITYERLEGDGLAWPCPDQDHPGTTFLHKDKFARGLGLFHAVEHQPPDEVVDEEYPFWLSTGRVHVHYHTGTMTRVSPTLHAEIPEGKLEMHPEDAEKLGVSEGEAVKVASRRGEITAKVTITDRVDVGVVCMPFHFAETCANILTNPAHDPTAKIPELKVCAVRVEKAA